MEHLVLPSGEGIRHAAKLIVQQCFHFPNLRMLQFNLYLSDEGLLEIGKLLKQIISIWLFSIWPSSVHHPVDPVDLAWPHYLISEHRANKHILKALRAPLTYKSLIWYNLFQLHDVTKYNLLQLKDNVMQMISLAMATHDLKGVVKATVISHTLLWYCTNDEKCIIPDACNLIPFLQMPLKAREPFVCNAFI